MYQAPQPPRFSKPQRLRLIDCRRMATPSSQRSLRVRLVDVLDVVILLAGFGLLFGYMIAAWFGL